MSDRPFYFDAPEGAEKPDPKPLAPGQDPLHWLQDMRAKDPNQILNCIFDHDPLGLQVMCERVMRINAYMFDLARLLESALIEVAFLTSRAELGEIQLDWIEVCVKKACMRLIELDALDPIENLQVDQDERYPESIVEKFKVRNIYAKQASVEFNILPIKTRLAFYDVYADGQPVAEYLIQTGETPKELQTHIKNALQALGCLDPDGIPSSPVKKDKPAEDQS